MPAVSEKQRRFMGMVYAYKKGKLPPEKASKKVKEVAKHISLKDARDFAKKANVENIMKKYLKERGL